MRLDHIAYRVKDRYKTAKFLKDALGYTVGIEFQIKIQKTSKINSVKTLHLIML